MKALAPSSIHASTILHPCSNTQQTISSTLAIKIRIIMHSHTTKLTKINPILMRKILKFTQFLQDNQDNHSINMIHQAYTSGKAHHALSPQT